MRLVHLTHSHSDVSWTSPVHYSLCGDLENRKLGNQPSGAYLCIPQSIFLEVALSSGEYEKCEECFDHPEYYASWFEQE